MRAVEDNGQGLVAEQRNLNSIKVFYPLPEQEGLMLSTKEYLEFLGLRKL